jgi:hypothetical protein
MNLKGTSKPEDILFSFSSRCASPVPKGKIYSTPCEYSENVKSCSFISVNTSVSRFSSMSGTHEPYQKSTDDSLTRLKNQINAIHDEFQTNVSEKITSVEAARTDFNDLELDNGIPTLRWCAYCKGETSTEVLFVNSEKTFWSSVAVFLAGGVLGCCLVPYSLNSCKDMQVRCHKCKHILENNCT